MSLTFVFISTIYHFIYYKNRHTKDVGCDCAGVGLPVGASKISLLPGESTHAPWSASHLPFKTHHPAHLSLISTDSLNGLLVIVCLLFVLWHDPLLVFLCVVLFACPVLDVLNPNMLWLTSILPVRTPFADCFTFLVNTFSLLVFPPYWVSFLELFPPSARLLFPLASKIHSELKVCPTINNASKWTLQTFIVTCLIRAQGSTDKSRQLMRSATASMDSPM